MIACYHSKLRWWTHLGMLTLAFCVIGATANSVRRATLGHSPSLTFSHILQKSHNSTLLLLVHSCLNPVPNYLPQQIHSDTLHIWLSFIILSETRRHIIGNKKLWDRLVFFVFFFNVSLTLATSKLLYSFNSGILLAKCSCSGHP